MYYAKFDVDGHPLHIQNVPYEEGTINVDYYAVSEELVGKVFVLDQDVVREATKEEAEAKELARTTMVATIEARAKRDLLLAETDKLVGADRWAKYTTTQKGNITAYRQALRDLPTQEGFPHTVTFPELKL